jgi:hypothetical protein
MKKLILSLGMMLLFTSMVMAQGKKHKNDNASTETPQTITTNTSTTATSKPATTLKADDMAFKDLSHDFGSVTEGPDAVTEFTFKNNGNEPIVIEKAQPSCGCTVPSFSKEPIPPGATGTINVAFHTKNHPNQFNKTITVVSNAGTKVLTIKGNVEKAPTGSVPENTSMIRTN